MVERRRSRYFIVLRMPCAVLLLSIALNGTLCLMAWNDYRAQSERLNLHAKQIVASQADLRVLDALEAEVAAQLPEYRRLLSYSIFEERRPAWISALMREQHPRYRSISYRLEPKRLFEWAPRSSKQGLAIFATRMSLTTSSMHEADWLRIFNSLDKHAPGLYKVRHCRLDFTRKSRSASVDSLPLRASCELDWFTFAKPST